MLGVLVVSCVELTTDQLEYQQLARKFGREVIKPAATKYDQSGEVHRWEVWREKHGNGSRQT